MGSTFDAQALTLAQYGLFSNLPLIQRIVFSLHKTMNVIQDIPFKTVKTLRRFGMRYINNLPATNWVSLNSVPVTVVGTPVPFDEQLFLVRNKFQLDEFFMDEVNQIENPLDSQVEAWLENFAYDFNTKFIQNGHPGTAVSSPGAVVNDPNAPLGLRARLDFTPDTIQASLKISAGGVDISPGNVTASTANTFISYLNRLLYFMNAPTGEDVVLYMDHITKEQFEAAVRALGAGGGFSMTKDAFDRSIDKFKDATIRVTGYRTDQSTPVLLIEDVNGNDQPLTNQAASPGYQSIYAVKYGPQSFEGWQPVALQPRFLGLDPTNGVAYNMLINWGAGFWNPHNRAIGRLYAIKVQ